jgi:hypothetical protein
MSEHVYPKVSQDEDGIIHIVWGRGKVTVDDLKKALAIHRSISTGRSPITVSAEGGSYVEMDWNALEFSRSDEVCAVTLCSALIVQSSIQEHVARLFLWYHKPAYPARVFKSIEEARPWLLDMKAEYEHEP